MITDKDHSYVLLFEKEVLYFQESIFSRVSLHNRKYTYTKSAFNQMQ